MMAKEAFRKMSWWTVAKVMAQDVKPLLLVVAVVLHK